jgi:hypothetical protein
VRLQGLAQRADQCGSIERRQVAVLQAALQAGEARHVVEQMAQRADIAIE